jgi:hypothetical protein
MLGANSHIFQIHTVGSVASHQFASKRVVILSAASHIFVVCAVEESGVAFALFPYAKSELL